MSEVHAEITTEFTPELFEGYKKAFPQDEWVEEKFKKFLSNSDTNVLVTGYCDGNVAGSIWGHYLDRFDNDLELFIYSVDTAVIYWRKGVGRAMMDALKEHAKSRGASLMWVLTHKVNTRAQSFYEAMGGEQDPEGDAVQYEIKL